MRRIYRFIIPEPPLSQCKDILDEYIIAYLCLMRNGLEVLPEVRSPEQLTFHKKQSRLIP